MVQHPLSESALDFLRLTSETHVIIQEYRVPSYKLVFFSVDQIINDSNSVSHVVVSEMTTAKCPCHSLNQDTVTRW